MLDIHISQCIIVYQSVQLCSILAQGAVPHNIFGEHYAKFHHFKPTHAHRQLFVYNDTVES